MRIKPSKGQTEAECPEEKLKFLSYLDELHSTRALHPPHHPERANKDWVMDAW